MRPANIRRSRSRSLQWISPFLTCLALTCFAAELQAGVVVSIGNSLVSTGGPIDYLPVYIRSTAGTVNLAATSFEFQITTNGSTPLQFVNSPVPALDPTFSDPNYVFFGVSGDQALNVPLGTAIAPDTFSGADEANNSDFFVPLGATPELLGLLPVTTLTNTAPPVLDTFAISLIPNSPGNPTTSFADDNATSISIAPESFTPGQATVTPEPSTLSLMMLGLAGWTVAARRRRRARLASGSSPAA